MRQTFKQFHISKMQLAYLKVCKKYDWYYEQEKTRLSNMSELERALDSQITDAKINAFLGR